MTHVLVYSPEYHTSAAKTNAPRWHSNHRVFGDLIAGDRLWVVTSGKSLGVANESAAYIVAVWPVAEVVKNPGDDPQFPARKYQHRVLVNETEAIQLDEPVCVDNIIRREGYDAGVPIGRFLRGPRRLTDEKVRKLRSAAGADMARKWLTASNPRSDNGTVAIDTLDEGENAR
jgi:hypothetical protein